MEDEHLAEEVDQADGKKGMLVCVFDGHGGKEVASFAKQHIKRIFMSTPDFQQGRYKEALIETFRILDEDIKQTEFALEEGATSCVVYFNEKTVYCANAGDSRAVMM